MKPQEPDHNPDNNPNKKAGTTMMILAWVVALALLISFFGDWEKNNYNPNRNPQSQQLQDTNTVVLQRNRYNHYVVNGDINQQKVTFLLDTGATDVSVPESIANEIGLKRGVPQQVGTANGTITVYRTRLNTLRIGDIVLYNVAASINQHMEGVGVLLGMSALKDIEFTQRGEQLTLKQYR